MKHGIIGLVLVLSSLGFAQYSLTEASEARFYINEVLLGKDKTVIGVSSAVTGEFSFDLSSPQTASIGTITINARNFVTDDDRRNGQIRNRILESAKDAYQFITFSPGSISGLPERLSVGDSFAIEISGDLRIKDKTQTVVFATTVTVVSENEVKGLGSTIIEYADFGIGIPSVPIVARVDQEVKLELDFTAIK